MGHGVPHGKDHGEALVHGKVLVHGKRELEGGMELVHGMLVLEDGMVLVHGMLGLVGDKALVYMEQVLDDMALAHGKLVLVHDRQELEEHKEQELGDMALAGRIWEESMVQGHKVLQELVSRQHQFRLLLHQSV